MEVESMNLLQEDRHSLENICNKYGVDVKKVIKLLEIENKYAFKERRIGIENEIIEVLKTIQEINMGGEKK